MDAKQFLKALERFEATDPGAFVLRDLVSETLRELAHVESALTKAELIVRSERGTLRGNPLLEEARKHRLVLAKLVSQLFPDENPGAALARRRRRSS